LLFAASSGALYALAMPPFAVWPLAFLCLVPLLHALRGRGLFARMAWGAVAGAAAGWGTSLVPTAVGLASFFDRPLVFGVVAALAINGTVGGSAFALFAALAGDPSRGRAMLVPWRVGAAFAVCEIARSQLFTGLPWLLLAHALAPAPALAQPAAWIGVIGVGLALAVANGALAVLVRREARRSAALSLASLALAFASADRCAPAVAIGDPGSIARAEPGTAARSGAIRVALVQPGTPGASLRDATRVALQLDQLVAVTRSALPADLVVWPENAIGVALPANESLVRDAVAQLAPRPALLFGAPAYDPASPTRVFNSVLLWDASGAELGRYDKTHLLPFTEFVPRSFAALGVRGGHTAAGASTAPLAWRDTKLGILICYELLFPDLSREVIRHGAGVLINPSNDAWFGRSAGPAQMAAAAVLRAVATRRPLLRATPTGITAAIDARGRVVAQLARGASGALIVDVWPTSGNP
jgi:apolipoprotein N-acyltransferase